LKSGLFILFFLLLPQLQSQAQAQRPNLPGSENVSHWRTVLQATPGVESGAASPTPTPTLIPPQRTPANMPIVIPVIIILAIILGSWLIFSIRRNHPD
jgi:hypothetical protein